MSGTSGKHVNSPPSSAPTSTALLPKGPQKDPRRELEICALYSGGETNQQIAERYGVSRERIRQVLARNGLGGQRQYTRIDPLRVMGLVTECESLEELAARVGHNPRSVKRLLLALGEWDACTRRWDMYHVYTDDELIEAFRRVAEELGRTPKQVDLRGRRPCPFIYTYRFGSLPEVARRAGLPVRYKRPDKLTRAQRAEIKRRYRPAPLGKHGSNAKELAKEYGVTPNRIWQIVHDYPKTAGIRQRGAA